MAHSSTDGAYFNKNNRFNIGCPKFNCIYIASIDLANVYNKKKLKSSMTLFKMIHPPGKKIDDLIS